MAVWCGTGWQPSGSARRQLQLGSFVGLHEDTATSETTVGNNRGQGDTSTDSHGFILGCLMARWCLVTGCVMTQAQPARWVKGGLTAWLMCVGAGLIVFLAASGKKPLPQLPSVVGYVRIDMRDELLAVVVELHRGAHCPSYRILADEPRVLLSLLVGSGMLVTWAVVTDGLGRESMIEGNF